jgi:hypothetical protein
MENTIKITSQEEVRDEFQLALLLREIANKIEKGYTTGYYPHWQVEVVYQEELEYND